MNEKLPPEEVTYQVMGLFHAPNESEAHWVRVGPERRKLPDADKDLAKWRNDYPDREWKVAERITTWRMVD